jgi:hypothetical protein
VKFSVIARWNAKANQTVKSRKSKARHCEDRRAEAIQSNDKQKYPDCFAVARNDGTFSGLLRPAMLRLRFFAMTIE